MLKSQHLVLLVMMIILAIAFLTFFWTYSLVPPKEKTPHRARVVVTKLKTPTPV